MTSKLQRAEEEINQTILLIEGRLQEPGMQEGQNKAVKLGYEKALVLLQRRETEYNICKMIGAGEQARAISVLAVEYLLGECSQEVLVNVPLKE